MDDAQLTLRFTGEATEDHLIDAKDLAPAILHLAETVERTGQIVAPDIKVKLNVRATKDGSFLVEFLVTAWDKMVTFFISPPGEVATSITTIIGTLLTVIGLVKKKAEHGGNPTVVSLDDSQVEVTYPDGTKLTTHRRNIKVADDPIAAASLRAMLDPLQTDGIDGVELASGHDKVAVSSGEVTAFGTGLEENADIIQIERMPGVYLQATTVSFAEHGKWRLTDGQSSPFYVTVEDQGFLDRIDTDQERFGKNDIFVADVRKEFRFDKNKRLKADTFIERVVQHLTPEEVSPMLPPAPESTL